MKNKILLICLTITPSPLLCDSRTVPLFGKTFFSPRSQSTNAVRQWVNMHNHTHQENPSCRQLFSITAEYDRSFDERRIAEYFFGTTMLYFSGSMVPVRLCSDILADYFGLSPNFMGSAELKPHINTKLIEFNYYHQWNDYYFSIYAPFVWVKSGIDIEEFCSSNCNTPFPASYMASGEVAPGAKTIKQALNGVNFGQVRRLKFGRINGTKSEKKLADVHLVLGMDLIKNELDYAGFNLRVVVPTGNRPHSQFLLEPVIGNGKHWELGLGFEGAVEIWERDGQQTLTMNGIANATHLFNARQCRSFDLKCNGFGSRYVLAKEFDKNGIYTGVTQPAINITTLPVKVKSHLQFDVMLAFAYHHNPVALDFGYNLWFRTRETVELECGIPYNRYALKGIQDVAGPDLNATQHRARLHGNQFDDQSLVADVNPPDFFNTSDLDISSAESCRGLTHKLFWNLGYEFNDNEKNKRIPFIGIGSAIEFDGINRLDETQTSKNSLSQWSFWAQGGLTF